METTGKKILVLGGTGAMGMHLVRILAGNGNHVSATSRSAHKSEGNITWLKGNAKDDVFLKIILKEQWDAIIDFMIYTTEEFHNRADLLLAKTSRYIFISSARVYDDSEEAITESSPRLLDTSNDREYLETDEYALAKARQENILQSSARKNWIIVRPSITYSSSRLQLGALEKENWLYRAMHGRSIVFSYDIAEKFTTMSAGNDVAEGIAALTERNDINGETFHIVSGNSYQWKEILEVYLEAIEERTGKRPDVVMTDKSAVLKLKERRYQVIYGRYFSRKFDNSKISRFIDTEHFVDAKTGLRECLNEFLDNPEFRNINWRLEAYLDREAGERTPWKEICMVENKFCYFSFRYGMGITYRIYRRFKNAIKKVIS